MYLCSSTYASITHVALALILKATKRIVKKRRKIKVLQF
jgi:hypothetical protein